MGKEITYLSPGEVDQSGELHTQPLSQGRAWEEWCTQAGVAKLSAIVRDCSATERELRTLPAVQRGNPDGGIMPGLNRWWIAVAGFFLQMALGAAYAWSVFRIPLSKEFGWSISEVTWTFLISWFFLGASSFIGGLWMKRRHPRVVAMTAGLLWGGGVFLATFSAHKLWWLYLTYGVIGGTGLGMGYVVPIAVLVKWFPERRGFITGLAVAGFGVGSLFSAPAAGWLMRHVGLMPTFAYLGVAYGIVAIAAGSFMQNPPDGWKPEGWTPTATQISQRSDRDYTLRQALGTLAMVGHLHTDVGQHDVGIVDLTQASPIFQEMGKASAETAAFLVGIVAIGNGAGRIFWSWVSDLTIAKNCILSDVSRRSGPLLDVSQLH